MRVLLRVTRALVQPLEYFCADDEFRAPRSRLTALTADIVKHLYRIDHTSHLLSWPERVNCTGCLTQEFPKHAICTSTYAEHSTKCLIPQRDCRFLLFLAAEIDILLDAPRKRIFQK